MKKFHSFGWYAAQISPYLPKKAFQPTPSRLFLGLVYLLTVLSGILVISLFDLHVIWNTLISVVLGFSFAALGFLGHEILHGTVVRTPWLRDFLGAVAFWPLCTGPKLWRKWHNATHHVHTQNEEKDPDAWPSMSKLAQSRLLRWIYKIPFTIRAFFAFSSLTIMFTFHSIRMLGYFRKQFQPKNRAIVFLQFMLPWISWIGLLFIVGFANWFFSFLLPLLIANFIVMSYISTNHRLNPLVPVNDPLANSLSVTVPKWVDFLHFNFSYHTEHHLFPSMSSKYYPLVKEHIKRMWPDRYHEMPMLKALWALWKTPRLYYQQNELVEPRQGNVYGSLGNGLNPSSIEYRKIEPGTQEGRISSETDR
ncbi:acyl-CoA desaturase [Anoxybacillus rupiensis]|jgi:fatty acid desaturase|uniref:Acyl-CoA desaturase n=1 Tax=Anoxybacteroides rupiense TaxID=311460 RepID=A0ABD5IWA8_9BACL|nr:MULTISPECIES: acyl-CoA desaturase [Anoxybacillus]KXG10752.1 Delta(12)-fatty-acid desaturase [Anoxybacillus sp. P3H1B]MBB3905956.1 fatty acid desaturase [Anoxybacillus rupiensis]MDE8565486.1 acyl-CoA desaturase [Anoxybacillus rupiensis]MED5051676.1 acyl-CoA desaturase [Anoxybacillus rupiensis]OQM45472.1 acyl-CoA desaturase [Anoxybacillus sp. UARK-01]